LGIKAVLAQSYERIHRSNLIGMGVLPLQFRDGEGPDQLGLDGTEAYDIGGIAQGLQPGCNLKVVATRVDGSRKEFEVLVRLDTPVEVEYYRHGGILKYVLRQLSRG
jgi:aconitate hydratase